MIVPMQHLLAAPGSLQNGMTSSAEVKHDHHDHMTSLSVENKVSGLESNYGSHCKSASKCKFCLDIMLSDIRSDKFISTTSYSDSLRSYISLQSFPELRPPRHS